MAAIKTLVVGGGGREAALAWRLSEGSVVNAILGHRNPTIQGFCDLTGGKTLVDDYLNPGKVAEFARAAGVELAVVANDNALAVGVVDGLRSQGIATVGADRAAARIEWDKAYARGLLSKHLPDLNPEHWVLADAGQARALFKILATDRKLVVVKPQGLTGGKGVKVMGDHLETFDDALAYALELLSDANAKVVIEEKLEGVEFTIQAVTDGKTFLHVPLTYDFPYLLDGDRGPGTGGMGAFCGPKAPLPFLTSEQYAQAMRIVDDVLRMFRAEGLNYTGVLNVGLFATPTGLRVMEFNARFGDPEGINIMNILNRPFVDLCQEIADGTLRSKSDYISEACVVKYLVAPEYAVAPPVDHRFELNVAGMGADAVRVFFASSERTADGRFRTVGASRCVALATTGATLDECSTRIEDAIRRHVRGPLKHRVDVGADAYVRRLVASVAPRMDFDSRSHAIRG